MQRVLLSTCLATILAPVALTAQTVTRFVARLDGAQEVPPNNSNATGVGVFYLHEPDNRIVYEVNSTGLPAAITGAHIHQAAVGVNGPVIVGFVGGPSRWCGVGTLTAAQVTALKASGCYANLHTAAFPGGEIRGQLLPADPGVFVASPMNGAQENPPVRTLGIGHGSFELNPDNTLRYSVFAESLSGAPTAAHIHTAPVGVNGPVTFPITLVNPLHWQGTTPVLTAAQLNDLRTGNMYVNVHTAANPGGEIRGQINLGSRATTFGQACAGTGGARAEAGSDFFPSIGGRFFVRVYGARPSIPALLVLSPSPAGTPIDMGGIGAPGCLFYLNPALLFFFFTSTDTTGCASVDLSLPYDRSLLGAPIYLQWLLVDAGANAGNLVVSNGLKGAIQ
jgi:hypothetical protein